MLDGVVTTRAAASLVAMAVGIILLNELVLEEGWIEAGSSAPGSASMGLAEELRALAQLHAERALSDEEFASA